MNGIQLHDVVRPLITFIHPDEMVSIYHAHGQVNNKGILTPIYEPPILLEAQIQMATAAALTHTDTYNETMIRNNFYLFANEEWPTAGMVRQLARGGDIIERQDTTYWLVTTLIEDFSKYTSWICVQGVLQTITPDFSASPWFKERNDEA